MPEVPLKRLTLEELLELVYLTEASTCLMVSVRELEA